MAKTYLIQKKVADVDRNQIMTNRETLTTLQDKGGIKYFPLIENRSGHYRKGQITEFQFVVEETGDVFYKRADGTALINTLCEYANCNLIRVSSEGKQESRLIGWIIEPISE